MWKIADFLLIAILAGGAIVEGFGGIELKAPTDLITSHYTHREVQINWKHEKPPSLGEPENPAFNITLFENLDGYQFDASLTKLVYSKISNETSFNLSGLRPSTCYSVKIFAFHPECYESESALEDFTTMAVDWPAPTIKNVTPVETHHSEDYDIDWDLADAEILHSLESIEVRVCLSKQCEVYKAKPADRELRVSMSSFSAPYSVKVIAVYKQPHIERIERRSESVSGLTVTSIPGRIEELDGEHERDQINIRWSPPQIPNGRATIYEVVATDSWDPSNTISTFAEGTSATLIARELKGPNFQVKIRAINLDPATRETLYEGEWSHYMIAGYLPPMPKGITIKKRDPTWISFIIHPAPGVDEPLFQIECQDAFLRQGLISGYQGEIYHLYAYQLIRFSIRSCFASDANSSVRCGEALELQERANVEAPFPVGNLQVGIDGGVARLNWTKPALAQGPVDGYKIFIIESDEDNLGIKEFEFNTTDTSFEYQTASDKQYQFAVLAYNIDLTDKSRVHIGPKDFVQPDASLKETQGMCIILTLTFCATMFSLLAGHLQSRKYHPNLYKKRVERGYESDKRGERDERGKRDSRK